VGRLLKPGDVAIYESTVYPGATEEICVPILERESGLRFNADFFAGYSPERINPGDKEHRVTSILKVTSGSTPERRRSWTHCTGASLPPEPTAPPASGWRKPPR
jgi:UDP-N-acetyl-D-galactosamine dehydrogenase